MWAGGSRWRWGRWSVRRDERAGQPTKVSQVGQRIDERRRGRLGCGTEVMTEVVGSARRQLDGLLYSQLVVNGSGAGVGVAQGSPSNYRLKLTVRGRSVPESRSRSRTAA